MDLVGVISRWCQNYTFDNALTSEKGNFVKCVGLTPDVLLMFWNQNFSSIVKELKIILPPETAIFQGGLIRRAHTVSYVTFVE